MKTDDNKNRSSVSQIRTRWQGSLRMRVQLALFVFFHNYDALYPKVDMPS